MLETHVVFGPALHDEKLVDVDNQNHYVRKKFNTI